MRAIDQAVDGLVRGEAAWAACDLAKRRKLLEQMQAATAEAAEAWVRAAVVYKRLPGDSPLLDKPATSELGGVSPTIVLPGGWSEADLR
ncbi:hypothetical protein QNO09_36295 [Streptomyces sp. 378]|uniref:hypothetical protein n=1 Tax=Streptomyces sp. 378 TaxID=3049412 RepID=UPI0024C3832A|nr:hypothetical protein [Streptomyces sp. 378]MDK1348635.1 hypothetical protein [Streptomyces sp. 378]